VPTKAKSQEPTCSQALIQNKIDRQGSRSGESGRQTAMVDCVWSWNREGGREMRMNQDRICWRAVFHKNPLDGSSSNEVPVTSSLLGRISVKFHETCEDLNPVIKRPEIFRLKVTHRIVVINVCASSKDPSTTEPNLVACPYEIHTLEWVLHSYIGPIWDRYSHMLLVFPFQRSIFAYKTITRLIQLLTKCFWYMYAGLKFNCRAQRFNIINYP